MNRPSEILPRAALPALLLLVACSSAQGPVETSGGTHGGATGGSTSGTGGTGGAGGGATGGGTTGGTGGTGGGTTTRAPRPSAGCSKTPGASGARTIAVEGYTGNYLVSLPTAYDSAKPYPLGFAFHGYGRTHEQCRDGDCRGFQSVMSEEAILVYPKSFTEGWEQDPVRDKNAALFESILDATLAEFCVDEGRVFVAGTSSGASFSNVLACRYGDRLLAAAPVAGSLPENTGCQGNPAIVAIHGIDDPHVTFAAGEAARDFFLGRNGCSTTTTPDLATTHATIRASRDAMTTNQACVDYQGCSSAPVRWCEHSEGGYDNSTHGWPTAGGQLIWDFVSPL